MKEAVKLAFVAALEREVRPLLEVSSRFDVNADGRARVAYRLRDAVLLCSGPGYRNASTAAKLVIEEFSPEMIVSIGFAGALASDLKIGEVFIPRQVISERNGSRFTSARGKERMLTAEAVVGEERKYELFKRFHVQAVDMEAAAVAEIAAARGCEFLAMKVISDELNSRVGFVGPFISAQGFRTRAFLTHVAFRPWLWPAVGKLQRDTVRASESLCRAVRVLTEQGIAALEELCPQAELRYSH